MLIEAANQLNKIRDELGDEKFQEYIFSLGLITKSECGRPVLTQQDILDIKKEKGQISSAEHRRLACDLYESAQNLQTRSYSGS